MPNQEGTSRGNQVSRNQNSNLEGQNSYFNLYENQSLPYYPAERREPSYAISKDSILTRSRDKGKEKSTEDTQPDYPKVIVEFPEAQSQPQDQSGDVQMNEAPEAKEPKKPEKLKNLTKPRKTLASRRKSIDEDLPQIASLIPKYSIVADLQNQKADITYGQLLLSAPGMRQDLVKSLQKKKTPPKRKQRTNIGIRSGHKSTALYCDAKVNKKTIALIVDSGSSGSVVSSHLLQIVGMNIERPSTVNMISVHGESKRVIGEISNFRRLYDPY